MRFYYLPFATLVFLTACEQAPQSVVQHPQSKRVQIDDHTIYVVPQAGNSWVASGGEEGKDGIWIQYRQERAIEVQSHCRIKKVTSKPGEPLLRATVHKCQTYS